MRKAIVRTYDPVGLILLFVACVLDGKTRIFLQAVVNVASRRKGGA